MEKISDEDVRLEIRNSIQTEKENKRSFPPLFWPPRSLMNQQSLELCTESLGSETGSDGFSSAEEFYTFFAPFCSERDNFEEKACEEKQMRRKELTAVKKQCSVCRASPHPRSFPPPLSSAFIQMRSFRRDGQLILKAFSVSSNNYLHAERHSGRVVLSFNRFVEGNDDDDDDDDGKEKDAEEEEALIVDRGTVVQVKASITPQLVNGVAAAKVLWSTLVINKFVVGAPLADSDESTVKIGVERICLMTVAAAAEAKLLIGRRGGAGRSCCAK